MKNGMLAFVFAAAMLPTGFAQTQSTSSTEKSEQHSSTTVNPDGSAVHDRATTREKTDSVANPDGSTTTTRTREHDAHSKERSNAPAGNSSTERHSSSSSTTTTTSPNF
ncbi:MAG TPA: hypothetical protein VKB79_16545 [Bryobacteraceae bacterium]|nr:hypothetical protein [Bryobacteraceae bacterium]